MDDLKTLRAVLEKHLTDDSLIDLIIDQYKRRMEEIINQRIDVNSEETWSKLR